jgi:tetratricopeptide (TPR) repeat protein
MPVSRIAIAVVVSGLAAGYLVSGGSPDARDVQDTRPAGSGRADPLYTGSLPRGRVLMAQAEGASAGADAAPGTAPAAGDAPKPDLTALRYFSRQGDQRRVDAEIARLRLLYPGWSPPDNLNEPEQVGDPELDRMWQLFADGKYAEARSAVAARRAADPRWTPPEDLTARLNEAEGRARLMNASDAKQWETVLQVAAEVPNLLTCADPESLWRVGEAFANTDRADRARDAFQYVLKNCDDAGVRLATVQKALAVLDISRVDQLLTLERKGADGKSEFETVRADIVRSKIGRAAETNQTAAAADLSMLENVARTGTSADDPLVLGWYYLRQNHADQALTWFQMATSREDTAKSAEGQVLALSALGRNQEAEQVAYPARTKSDDMLKAYRIVATALLATDPAPRLEAGVLARTADELGRAREASGAQAVGWYSYNTNQIGTAIQWFTTALGWDPNDEPSAYGLALSYQNQKDRAGFNRILQQWGSRSQRIADLAVDPRRRRSAAPPVAIPAPKISTAQIAAPAVRDPVQTGGISGSISRASDAIRAERAAAAAAYTPSRVQFAASVPAPPQPIAPAMVRETVRETVSEPAPRAPRAMSREDLASSMLDDFSEPVRAPREVAVTQVNQPAVRGAKGPSGCPLARNPTTAANRGWCLMELERPMEAIEAFDVAIQTGTGQVKEDAAYGKALANLRAGLTGNAAVAATEAAQSPRRSVELSVQILTQRAIASYRDEKYAETIIALNERSRYVPEQNDLMMMRGWAYFNLRRYSDAQRIFTAVSKTGDAAGMRGLVAIGEVTGRIKD